MKIPARQSLIAQAAAALREGIREGAWRQHLPGERTLCTQLQVSRPTLRAALEVLQGEGSIGVSHGKRRTIADGGTTQVQVEPVVTVLSPVPLHRMQQNPLFYIDEMRNHLQGANLRLEIVSNPRLRQNRPQKLLENIVLTRRASCWILLTSTEMIQQWFARNRVPSLVVGSCFAGTRLPSLDIDHQATCRHASGILLGKGHRHLALLLPNSGTAGEVASEAGFNDGIRASRLPDAAGTTVYHDGSKEEICRRLDGLLRLRSKPTGLIVCKPLDALTAMSHLHQRGLRLPQDMALISRDDDSYLSALTPEVSRYSYSRRHFAERLSKLAIQLATAGTIPLRQNLILPKFVAGETAG